MTSSYMRSSVLRGLQESHSNYDFIDRLDTKEKCCIRECDGAVGPTRYPDFLESGRADGRVESGLWSSEGGSGAPQERVIS